MKIKDKGFYETPTTQVVEMKTQSVLCASVYTSIFFMNSTSDQWGRDDYGDGVTENWN